MLLYEGYSYTCSREDSETSYWIFRNRKGCKAKIATDKMISRITRRTGEHSHPGDPTTINLLKVRNTMKEKAEVPDAFEDLVALFSTDAMPLALYFEDTYIGRRRRNGLLSAMFPTSVWSVHASVLEGLPRTNNAAEAWHRSFQPNHLKTLVSVVPLVALPVAGSEVSKGPPAAATDEQADESGSKSKEEGPTRVQSPYPRPPVILQDDDGLLDDAPHRRRPRATTATGDRHILGGALGDSFRAARDIRDALELDISHTTVWRHLYDAGLYSHVACQSPLLTERHKQLRLDFPHSLQNRTVEDWTHVIFSDESTFCTQLDQQSPCQVEVGIHFRHPDNKWKQHQVLWWRACAAQVQPWVVQLQYLQPWMEQMVQSDLHSLRQLLKHPLKQLLKLPLIHISC
ncbi:hypothetical protein ISCGN_032157 [Ixodes scapularis]